jgi:hypothetical protein
VCLLHCRTDAVVGDKGLRIRKVGRDAGGGDGFVAIDARGDVEVEVKELLEEVFLDGEAIGNENGGVEGGVGIFDGILAGEFERAIDGAEAAMCRVGRENCLLAQARWILGNALDIRLWKTP